jgi:hypothetical protein
MPGKWTTEDRTYEGEIVPWQDILFNFIIFGLGKILTRLGNPANSLATRKFILRSVEFGLARQVPSGNSTTRLAREKCLLHRCMYLDLEMYQKFWLVLLQNYSWEGIGRQSLWTLWPNHTVSYSLTWLAEARRYQQGFYVISPRLIQGNA